jgi:hypothetical protein
MATLTLTTLPSEIRASIFDFALRSSNNQAFANVQELGLLGTSKQIHQETHLLPFQINALACPAVTDSSTSATDKVLHRLSWQQRNAIRRVELQVTGSTLDQTAAAKIFKYLRLGACDGDVDSGVGHLTLPSYDGQLRKVELTVSARDIAVPLADCRVGLQQALNIHCPMFAWLQSFPTLRLLKVHIRLRTKDQFPQVRQDELLESLKATGHPALQLQVSSEVVEEQGYFIDELDLYRDSYLGIFGNVGPGM